MRDRVRLGGALLAFAALPVAAAAAAAGAGAGAGAAAGAAPGASSDATAASATAAHVKASAPWQLVDAIRASDYASVKRQLVAHSSPDAQLPDGSTALSWAVETQDPRMVKLLLDARANPDAARNADASALLLACEHGNAGIVEQLVAAGADVRRARADGIAPLALCAGQVAAPTLAKLIARGASVDAADHTGQTALMWAAARGRVDNIELLLARGADVNRITAGGFTPLFFALKSGNPRAPDVIYDAGGDASHVGPEATTAVQLAMYQKDYAFAARLVENGASLTALDRNGHSLLHAATLANETALVRLLLARGADPHQLTGRPRVQWRYEANFKTGEVPFPPKTALQLATEKDFRAVMQLLADASGHDGRTLLARADARATFPIIDQHRNASGGVHP